MRLLIISAAFTLMHFVNAQDLFIVDQQLKTPIQFAHFIVYHNNEISEGHYSQKDGAVKWNQNLVFDSIVVSNIGFATQVFKEKPLPDTIFLVNQFALLPEIGVSRKLNEERRIGFPLNYWPKYHSHTTMGGIQFVTLVQNSFEQPKKIKSFSFYQKKTRVSGSPKVKVVFFANTNGIPGPPINFNKIIRVSDFSTRKIEVDLQEFNLELPVEGLFVGIEFFGCDGDSLIQTSTFNLNCSLSFLINKHTNTELALQYFARRVFYQKDWTNINDLLPKGMRETPAFFLVVID